MTDTIKLADGTEIDVETGRRIEQFVEVPTHSEAVQEITDRRKRLLDLPEAPETMNVISMVLSYSLIGLSNLDIAKATSLEVSQIERVKETPAYAYMLDEMTQAIMERDAEDIRMMFRVASKRAARKMSMLVDHESAGVALAASKDILDRDGFKPSDTLEIRKREESTLRIEVVKKNDDAGRIIDGELT